MKALKWVSFVIIVCLFLVFSLSFVHSMELFASLGFNEQIPIPFTNIRIPTSLIATVYIEVIYLTAGALLLGVNARKKRLLDYPYIFWTLVFSSLMVGWSNVAGTWGHGLGGALVGLSIPLGLILLKGMHTDTKRMIEEEKENERATDQPDYRYHSSYQMVGYQNNNQMVGYQNNNQMVGYQIDDQMVSNQDKTVSDHHSGNHLVDRKTLVSYQTDGVYLTSKETVKTKQDNQQMDSHHNATDQPDNQEQVTDRMDDHDQDVDWTANQMTDRNQDADRMDDQPDDRNQPNDQPDNHDKMDDATDHDTEKEIEKAKEIALRIKAETGKLPGRVKLEKAAGCRQWVARKALADLKKTG